RVCSFGFLGGVNGDVSLIAAVDGDFLPWISSLEINPTDDQTHEQSGSYSHCVGNGNLLDEEVECLDKIIMRFAHSSSPSAPFGNAITTTEPSTRANFTLCPSALYSSARRRADAHADDGPIMSAMRWISCSCISLEIIPQPP